MKYSWIKRDWERNRHSLKSLFIVMFFRLSSCLAQNSNPLLRWLGSPLRLLYKVIVEVLIGTELPDRVVAGPGLAVFHGVGLVLNAQTRLGSDVTLRQNTTIGSSREGGLPPRIGDGVSVGANCVIIGDIEVGSYSIIGAGAILTRDCPPNSIVYGHKSIIRDPGAEDKSDDV